MNLTYGSSCADSLGLLATLIGLAGLVGLFVVPTVRRWSLRRRAGV